MRYLWWIVDGCDIVSNCDNNLFVNDLNGSLDVSNKIIKYWFKVFYQSAILLFR